MSKIERFFRQEMNLRHLRLLVALDEFRHVRRVAAYLNVSQPAVSKALANIEEGLGVELFYRTRRGMEPTIMGACLIRSARDIQARLNETQNELIDIDQNRVGRIALGVLPTASVLLVPKLIAYMEAMASSVAIKVTEGTMASLLPAVRAGDIDLAIGLLPHAPLPAEFTSELLMEDQIVAAVRSGHPLTRLAEPTWEDLTQFPMILPPDNATTRMPIDAILAANRMSASHRRVETVSSMASVGALQLTDSVGFLAETLAQHFTKLGVVSVLRLELPEVTLRLGMIWLKDARATKASQLTQELLRLVCREIRGQEVLRDDP